VGKGGGPPVQYVWGLIHKGQEFRELILHPVALDHARHVLGDDLLLFSYSGNAIGPGAAGGGAHTDQIYMPADTPWPVVCNVIYMLDDFTEDNGATLVVPGSHRRNPDDLNPESFTRDAIPAIGSAGSALVMESRVWHSIGVNRTDNVVRHGILAAYCKPFLRTQSSWRHTTPPDMLRSFSPELRELLGFHIWRSLGGLQGPYGDPLEAASDADPRRRPPSDAATLDVGAVEWGWAPAEPEIVREMRPVGSS
jgi:ectoine hydroxylase-related dioxygenase (phytanoyl-CoA dioxygenase family)